MGRVAAEFICALKTKFPCGGRFSLLSTTFLIVSMFLLYSEASAHDFSDLIAQYVAMLKDNPQRFLRDGQQSKYNDKWVLDLHKQFEKLDLDIPARMVFVKKQYFVGEKNKYYGVVDEDGGSALYIFRDKSFRGNILILSSVAPERLTILNVDTHFRVTRVFDSFGSRLVMARALRGVCHLGVNKFFLFQNQEMGFSTSLPEWPVLRFDLRTRKLNETASDVTPDICGQHSEGEGGVRSKESRGQV